MKHLLNPDNWFWRGFGRLADCCILSLCWLACSVPLLTAGAACIALYDAVVHCFREGDDGMVRRFFATFRQKMLRGVGLTVLWAVLFWLLNAGYQIIRQLAETGGIWTAFSFVYMLTLFVPLGILCWLVAIESRFSHSFGQLHAAAFRFTISCLPSTAAIVALLVVALNLLLRFPLLLAVLPAGLAYLQSIFIEGAFRKHLPEDGIETV